MFIRIATEWKKIGKTGKLTLFQGVCQHSMHRHLPYASVNSSGAHPPPPWH